MNEFKSIDFKNIAVKFTGRYYPRWTGRIDRIWEMLLKADLDISSLDSAGVDDGLKDALGMTGDVNPEFKEFMTSVALLAITYLNTKSASEERSHLDQSQMSPVLKQKFEDFLDEMVLSSNSIEPVEKSEQELYYPEDLSSSEVMIPDYKIWHNDSEPSGIPVDTAQKEKKVTEEKDQYDLFIVRQGPMTHFYKNGVIAETKPSKTVYRILALALKNRGMCGTAWNVATHIYDIDEAEKFRDMREMANVIKKQLQLNKELDMFKSRAGGIENYSNNVRGLIKKLNDRFLHKFNTSINANEMDEYELKPMINYCLIEKIKF